MVEREEVTKQQIQEEKDLMHKLFQLSRKEEGYWWLKSQSAWLKEGDKNTSFLYKQVKEIVMKNKVR